MADFRVLRGGEILGHAEFHVLGIFDVQWQPLLHARAVPGGPIARPAYDALRAEFLLRLTEAMPLDGVYLSMHGAAHVDGMEDCEGDFIQAVRVLVGPDCPIAASYDLHGNMSQAVVDALDMLAAYRTAPHVDVDETKSRAVAMLLRALEGGTRPFLHWARIPVLLPGERTSTEDPPAKRLYAALPAMTGGGVWEAALLVGYVWADEARASASVVVTGTDPVAMADAASEVARSWWGAREDFRFGSPAGSIDECLDQALAYPDRPVIVADSGDNPTAGGVGDRADMLAALLAWGAAGAILAGIADPPATAACLAAGVGATLALTLGGALVSGSPTVDVIGVVRFLSDIADEPERQAVLDVGGVQVVLTARRRPFHNLRNFHAVGLDPAAARLLVVKSGYLSPALARLAKANWMALSDGVVNQDVARLPITRIGRPMFPWDRDFAWQPAVLASARAP